MPLKGFCKFLGLGLRYSDGDEFILYHKGNSPVDSRFARS